ncbi:MAG TPA: hypothetical protein VK929_04500 [Longimicrobiales bacterium]|nr:hypothetical protein [Longimicrobiales bacterium]
MHIRKTLLVTLFSVLAAGAAPALAQQDDMEWQRNCERQAQRSERAVACQVRPLTTTMAAGALSVDAGQNGGISVAGSTARTGSDVRFSARIQAQAATAERAAEIADAVRIRATPGRISAEGLVTYSGESWTVSYHVEVPGEANLELQAVNGPLAVRDVNGRIRAVTVNGPVVLDNLAGEVHVRAQNGPLTVRLAGARWDGAGLDAETRNGPVSISMPDGYSAALETGTVNGPMSTSIPLTVVGQVRRGGYIRTTLGSGGAPIRVVTTNGPATIRSR